MSEHVTVADPEKFSWTQDVEDEIEKNYGGPVDLNFKEMLENADKISEKIAEEEMKDKTKKENRSDEKDPNKTPVLGPIEELSESAEDSLDALVAESDQLSGFQVKQPDKYQMTRANLSRPRRSVSGTDNESFTSQRETAEIRNDIEILGKKLTVVERSLEALLKEREALPEHFKKIQESMNRQLTLMTDKINFVLENNAKSEVATVVKETVEAVRTDANENLSAMRSLALAAPSTSSPLAKPGSSLAGKRRFKPVK